MSENFKFTISLSHLNTCPRISVAHSTNNHFLENLAVPGLSCHRQGLLLAAGEIFTCSIQTLSCIMWDLVTCCYCHCSAARSCLTLCDSQHTRLPCPSLFLCLLKHMSTESVMPSNYLILCHPLLFLPLTFPSTRVFFNELALCIRWPKYWSFSFSTSPSWPGIKPRAPVLGTQSFSHQTATEVLIITFWPSFSIESTIHDKKTPPPKLALSLKHIFHLKPYSRFRIRQRTTRCSSSQASGKFVQHSQLQWNPKSKKGNLCRAHYGFIMEASAQLRSGPPSVHEVMSHRKWGSIHCSRRPTIWCIYTWYFRLFIVNIY